MLFQEIETAKVT